MAVNTLLLKDIIKCNTITFHLQPQQTQTFEGAKNPQMKFKQVNLFHPHSLTILQFSGID